LDLTEFTRKNPLNVLGFIVGSMFVANYLELEGWYILFVGGLPGFLAGEFISQAIQSFYRRKRGKRQ
jgi:hypothetical protein